MTLAAGGAPVEDTTMFAPSRHIPRTLGSRISRGALLALTLLPLTPGLPAPTVTAASQYEPAARLEVVVNEIHIWDDREGWVPGDGEMKLTIKAWTCDNGEPAPCISQGDSNAGAPGLLVSAVKEFSANTHETKTLNRVVPADGDAATAPESGAGIGFPVYPDVPTVVAFEMIEKDSASGNDHMGWLYHTIVIGPYGPNLGTFEHRSMRADGIHVGDYDVKYELRRAPLPNIRPVNIKVTDIPGSAKKHVCMAVQNSEIGNAPPFEVSLVVDNTQPPGGIAVVPGLTPGNATEACVDVDMPKTGTHPMRAVVDVTRRMVEYNEMDNSWGTGYTAPAIAPTSKLSVTTIKVNGQVPDGKKDCKDGKNDVVAVVKNDGAAESGPFVVRLSVDEAQGTPSTVSIANLAAGQEQEARFEDVKLKSGEHKLTSTIDGGLETVAEPKNEAAKTVTATCASDR
jgi:hypothetical protein